MEVLRVGRNAWNQEVLQGASWDLLWVFVGAGALFIAIHMLYRLVWAAKPSPIPTIDGNGRAGRG